MPKNSTAKKNVVEMLTMKKVGRGVKYSVENDVLTIQINLTQEYGLSSSGKNVIIASTGGNKNLAGMPDGYKIGINCYRPADDEDFE